MFFINFIDELISINRRRRKTKNMSIGVEY